MAREEQWKRINDMCALTPDARPVSRAPNPYWETGTVELEHFIAASTQTGYPIGTVMRFWTKVPCGWQKADGRHLRVSDYPELFEVIGNRFCPPVIRERLSPSRFERFRRLLFLKPVIKYREAPNIDYRKGWFRLPDMR